MDRRKLEEESAGRDQYGGYFGRRSRVGAKETVRIDERECARESVSRDVRVDARAQVTVKKRRK
jgi:hypothetical protein